MTIFSAEQISKRYGQRVLFAQVSFGLARGDRLGVVGVNGSGKSSLLRIAAGRDTPDEGRVTTTNGLRVAYLPQSPELDNRQTVNAAIYAADVPALRTLHDYRQTSAALEHAPGDIALIERLNILTTQMDTLHAWDIDTLAETTLSRLGLAALSQQPIGTLSGGQRKRVALAQALLAQPDLLILDEPTNHIDTETIAWLERFLERSTLTLLLVTHDRYFLDRVANRMLELDQGHVFVVTGNYSSLLEQKAAREAQAVASEAARQNLLRKELAWLRRGARARSTKQKAHVQRVYDLQAHETAGLPQETMHIDLATRRIGKRVLDLTNVQKAYNDIPLVRDFTLSLQAADRFGIVGPNGAGKTTLLNMIAGRMTPDSGTIAVGETIHIGYYDQESIDLDDSQRVVDYIREAAELVRGTDGALVRATQMLERFLFPPEAQWALIGTLSGGERRRLYLLRTLALAPNLLLLDEPTNDLDIQTLTVLEDFLDSFPGAVIAVSHDRYFLDRTMQHTLAFEGAGRIARYPGGYSAFAEQRAAAEATAQPVAPGPKPARKASSRAPSNRLSYREQRELTQVEAQIDTLEARQTELTSQINQAGDDYERYSALAAELSQTEADLDAAVERWSELAARAE